MGLAGGPSEILGPSILLTSWASFVSVGLRCTRVGRMDVGYGGIRPTMIYLFIYYFLMVSCIRFCQKKKKKCGCKLEFIFIEVFGLSYNQVGFLEVQKD